MNEPFCHSLNMKGPVPIGRVVGRVGLEVGAFIDVLRNHRQRADLEDAEEGAERLLQREDDREFVRRLDLVELHQIAAGARHGSACRNSIENSTSAEVNGLPSCQVTPFASLKV